ncbi:hypothetical protein [Nocardiopsis sp. ATB16-24]|uniref:hypothetical protein n=1 Tax=Nocardiopsis sp. ATB16-24 TaxID=3019555 RepID=UPI0025521F6F|nr:hypothetical protein [Nocardiopsis sp. ATB16-24]
MPSTTQAPPEAEELTTGALVEVRRQKWVVSGVEPSPGATLVTLQSVEVGDRARQAPAPQGRVARDHR